MSTERIDLNLIRLDPCLEDPRFLQSCPHYNWEGDFCKVKIGQLLRGERVGCPLLNDTQVDG